MRTAALRTHGGSIAVTLPASTLKTLGLGAGDLVEIDTHDNAIIIRPAKRRKYTVADLLAMQGKAPLLVDKEWDAMLTAGLEGKP